LFELYEKYTAGMFPSVKKKSDSKKNAKQTTNIENDKVKVSA